MSIPTTWTVIGYRLKGESAWTKQGGAKVDPRDVPTEEARGRILAQVKPSGPRIETLEVRAR